MRPADASRRSSFFGLLALALLPALSDCEDVTGRDGDDRDGDGAREVRPALIVEVRAAATGNPAGAGAAVTVIDGAFSAGLEPVSALEFEGPPERPGRYVVRISKPGFVPVELVDVVVGREDCGSDDCHVVPVVLRVDLVPEEVPACVSDLIVWILNQPPYGAVVTRAMYYGRIVYYVPQPCCDSMNPLYDASCQVICHPDGGFGGTGDGLCSDYYDERWDVRVVWEDPRQ